MNCMKWHVHEGIAILEGMFTIMRSYNVCVCVYIYWNGIFVIFCVQKPADLK
jgi:hypothetical protein